MRSAIHSEGSISKDDSRVLTERLRDYATAIRDYQDLRNKWGFEGAEKRKRKLLLQRYLHSPTDLVDPFESHYAYFEDADHAGERIDPLRRGMMSALPAWLTFSHKEKAERTKKYQEGRHPKEVSTSVDRLARFSVALAGGCFLIVPMVIIWHSRVQRRD